MSSVAITQDDTSIRSADERDKQFIFREIEFEDEAFNAPTFISKYRRVSSLESIKTQLQSYCSNLKKELYDIINRDYREFITIATKLDGVDMRVEHLKKPLVDLRLDLAVLHDGLVITRRAVESKLKQREAISNRKHLIQSSLACMSQLDIAECILVTDSSSSSSGNSSKVINNRRRNYAEAAKRCHKVPTVGFLLVDTDVFECSEFERSACALTQASQSLVRIKSLTADGVDSQQHSGSSSSTPGLIQSLENRVTKLNNLLENRVKSKLSSMFNINLSEGSDAAIAESTSKFPLKAYVHLLRALVVTGKVDIVEKVVAEVVQAYIRSALTQGRVDGSAGRGSFTGLHDGLQTILKSISLHMNVAFDAAEAMNASSPHTTIDLIINGVWIPIATVLTERFPGMFSTAIANTVSRCYTAIECCTAALPTIAGDKWSSKIASRIKAHPSIVSFNSKWKLELYYQIRMQEVSKRLEKSCALSYTHGVMHNMVDAVYRSASASDAAALSVPITDIETFKVQTKIFQLPFISAFAIELCSCAHPLVMLKAVASKLFVLTLQVLKRLVIHIACLVDVVTPFLSKSDVAACVAIMQNTTISNDITNKSSMPADTAVATATAVTSSATPKKGSDRATAVASEVAMPAKAATAPILTIEELVYLSSDLFKLEGYLHDTIVPALTPCFGEVSCCDELTLCMSIETSNLSTIRKCIWEKVCALLGDECKRSLVAVKAVAGRYRMTNKPPPDTSSSYVATILQPCRAFIDKNESKYQVYSPTQSWLPTLLEDVTSVYLMQVQLLMETVKQMDTALQRRLKNRNTDGSNTAASMTDSEKISLQLQLDLKAYADNLDELHFNKASSPSYSSLYELLYTNKNDE